MTVKILLLCDNVVRELDSLRFLKSVLMKKIKGKVYIAGSLADWKRTYSLLNQLQPDVVFMTQIQEDKCRDLAEYVKKSGGKVCVIPPETTLVTALRDLTVNPNLSYDELIDFLFLPGESLRKLYRKTDIDESKIFVTGSPKVDVLIRAEGENFYSRNTFLQKYGIPANRKNIFIFTGFRGYSKEYIKTDAAFRGVIDIANEESDFIDKSLVKYLEILPVICERYSNYNIILKPHPLEDKNVYNKITSSNFYLLDQRYTLQMCLKSIDLAVHWNSTIAAECWLSGVKTIQYSPLTKYNYLLSGLSHGNPLYNDSGKFIDGIDHYLINKLETKYISFQRKYLKENYGSLVPNSSENIAAALESNLSKFEIKTNYKSKYFLSSLSFSILEKLMGPKISRWLVHFYLPNYNWKYSSENYVRE